MSTVSSKKGGSNGSGGSTSSSSSSNSNNKPNSSNKSNSSNKPKGDDKSKSNSSSSSTQSSNNQSSNNQSSNAQKSNTQNSNTQNSNSQNANQGSGSTNSNPQNQGSNNSGKTKAKGTEGGTTQVANGESTFTPSNASSSTSNTASTTNTAATSNASSQKDSGIGKVTLQQKGDPVSVDYDQTIGDLRDPEKRKDPSFNVAVLNFNKQYDPYPENGVQVFDKQGKEIKNFHSMSEFSSEMLTEQPKGTPTPTPAVDTFSNLPPAISSVSTTTGQGNSTPPAGNGLDTFTQSNPATGGIPLAMAQSTTPTTAEPTGATNSVPPSTTQSTATPTTQPPAPPPASDNPILNSLNGVGKQLTDIGSEVGGALYESFAVELPKKYGEYFADPNKMGEDISNHVNNNILHPEKIVPVPSADKTAGENVLSTLSLASMALPIKFGALGVGIKGSEKAIAPDVASGVENAMGAAEKNAAKEALGPATPEVLVEQSAKEGVQTGASSLIEQIKNLPEQAKEIFKPFNQKLVEHVIGAEGRLPGGKPENVIVAKDSGGLGTGVTSEQISEVLPSFSQKLLNYAAINKDKLPDNSIAAKEEISPTNPSSANKNTLPPKPIQNVIEANGQGKSPSGLSTQPATGTANFQTNVGAQSVSDIQRSAGVSSSGTASVSSVDVGVNGKLGGGAGHEMPQGNGMSLMQPEKSPSGNGGVGNEIPNAPKGNPIYTDALKDLEAVKSSKDPGVIGAGDKLKLAADNYLKNPTRENERNLLQAHENLIKPPVKPVQEVVTPPKPEAPKTTETNVPPSNTQFGPPKPEALKTTETNVAPANKQPLAPLKPTDLQTTSTSTPSTGSAVIKPVVTTEVPATPRSVAQTPSNPLPPKLQGKAEIELYQTGMAQAQDALKNVGQKYTGANGFKVQQSALNLENALKTFAESRTLESQKAVFAAQSNLSRLTNAKISVPKGPTSVPILPGGLSVKQMSQIVGASTGGAVGVSLGQALVKGQMSVSAGAGGNPSNQTSLSIPSSNAQTSKPDGVVHLPPYVDVNNDHSKGSSGSGNTPSNTPQNQPTNSSSSTSGGNEGGSSSTEGTSQSNGSSSSEGSGGGSGGGGGGSSGSSSATDTAAASSAGMAPMGAAGAGAAMAAGMDMNALLQLFLELSQKVWQGTATPEDFLTLQSIIPQLEEAGMLQDSPQILQLKQMVAENVPAPAEAPADTAPVEAAPAEAA